MLMIICLEDLFMPFAAVTLAVVFPVTYLTPHIMATISLYGPPPSHLSRRLETKNEVNV